MAQTERHGLRRVFFASFSGNASQGGAGPAGYDEGINHERKEAMELIGYVTTMGSHLSAKLLTGAALQVTRVTAGSGATSLDSAVLAQERQTLAASPMRRSGTTVTLPVTLLATQAEADYTLTEVGVYAQDPDQGEILYRIYRLDQALEIAAGSQLAIRFDLQETVSQTAEVTVAGTAWGLVTHGDLEAMWGAPGGLASLDGGGLVPVSQMPYTYGTADLTAGSSALETGKLYFVYE